MYAWIYIDVKHFWWDKIPIQLDMYMFSSKCKESLVDMGIDLHTFNWPVYNDRDLNLTHK